MKIKKKKNYFLGNPSTHGPLSHPLQKRLHRNQLGCPPQI